MAKLDVEIVTGERVVLSETDVDMVVAPGADGTLGILPQHAPLITTLAAGELRVKKGGTRTNHGRLRRLHRSDTARGVVLADTAERSDEIDVGRAEEARQRAEEALRNRGERIGDARSRTAALRRANAAPANRRDAGAADGVPAVAASGDNAYSRPHPAA